MSQGPEAIPWERKLDLRNHLKNNEGWYTSEELLLTTTGGFLHFLEGLALKDGSDIKNTGKIKECTHSQWPSAHLPSYTSENTIMTKFNNEMTDASILTSLLKKKES